VRSGLDLHLAITVSLTTRVTRPVNRLRTDCAATGAASAFGSDWARCLANRASAAPSTARCPAESVVLSTLPLSAQRSIVS
jgi:hypothetical protein